MSDQPTAPPSRTQPIALVVDDEAPLNALISGYLEREGYSVSQAFDGLAALERAREIEPTLVVLDVGLPGMDGIEVCREIRTFSDCYVIMVTARAEEVDTLVGLAVGADDYVTKPFSPRELMARVKVLARRPRVGLPAAVSIDTTAESSPAIVIGGLRINPESREVHVGERLIELTRTEFDLLAAMASRPSLVWTRRQLIDEVWGEGWVGDDHVVDVHIANLRGKLGEPRTSHVFVRTIRGVGYRMGSGS